MYPCITSAAGKVLGLAVLSLTSHTVVAEQSTAYRFESAAQEISQLYWLAETASVCGWATPAESDKFKRFSLRFLAAHLTDRSRNALISLVSQPRFETSLQRAAKEGAQENCGSKRWHSGWDTYKAAADENDGEY